MASLLLLIPLTLVLVGVALWAFFWATDHGQFDDLDTPASRILEEDARAAVQVDSEAQASGISETT